jgi:tetratricopeptide (TPR) repeat protein
LRWFDDALSCKGSADPRTRAVALSWAGAVGINSGEGVDLAIARGEEAVALLRGVDPDDRLSLADACELLGLAHMRPAQNERALELFDEVVALYAKRDDGWSRAVAASAAGLAAGLRGDLQAALEHHLASMEHFEVIGAEWAVASVGSDVARAAEARGDLEAAAAFTERAMLAARRLNLEMAEIQLGARLGNLRLCQGDIEGADALHEEAMALAEAVGSRVSYGVILTGRAMVRRAQGRLDEAVEAAAAALAVYRRTQLRSGEALSLALLGFATECLGDTSGAEELHAEALAAAHQQGDQRLVALAVEGLAGVAVARGDHERGAALLGAADHLRGLNEASSGPASDVDRIAGVIVDALGQERFDAIRRQGRDADLDALVQ